MKALFVGGRFNGLVIDVEDIEEISNGQRSMDWSEARKNGGVVPREELDNRPMVDGYLSPMWDGGMLRYETYEAYNILSM